jgi:hypothetical protein
MKKVGLNMCWKVKTGQYALIICIASILLLCLLGMPAWADDALSTKKDGEKTVYTVGSSDEKDNALDTHRDKEKTVYSIGSNKTKKDEEAKDIERSWDMLKNIGIVIDGRQDKHHSSKDPQSQTNQSQQKNQQTQPVPTK